MIAYVNYLTNNIKLLAGHKMTLDLEMAMPRIQSVDFSTYEHTMCESNIFDDFLDEKSILY